MRKFGLMALSGLLISAVSMTAHASTITYSITASGGTWSAFAQLSSADNAGLASISFNVVGSNGLTVTSGTVALPAGAQFTPPATFAATGFGFLENQGAAGVGMSASQNTVGGFHTDSSGDPSEYLGVGQTAGSVPSFVGGPVTWAAPVLIATGNYSGTVGTLTVTSPLTTNVQVFAPGTTLTEGSTQTTSNIGTITPGVANVSAAPEPASLGVLALGGLALLARRRKA